MKVSPVAGGVSTKPSPGILTTSTPSLTLSK